MTRANSITVILPAYNAASTIERCINSILKQNYSTYELLIIDDGSTDDTPQIIAQYAKQYPNIKIFTQANQGVSAARNVGIEHASGDWICFVDSDDEVEEDYLQKMLNLCISNSANIAICNYSTAYNPETSQQDTTKTTILDRNAYLNLMPQLFHGYVWNKIYSRKCIGEHRFNPNISYCEDFLFNLEVALHSNTFIHTNQKLYTHIANQHSASAKYDIIPNQSAVNACDIILRTIENTKNKTLIAIYAANFLPLLYHQRFLFKHKNRNIDHLLKHYEPKVYFSNQIQINHKLKLLIQKIAYPIVYKYRSAKDRYRRRRYNV